MEGELQNSSNINPVALLFLLGMSFVMLRGRREAAVNAILATAAFLPLGQQIVLFGLHLQFFRILMIVGLARLFIGGEARGVRFNRLDKLVIAWAIVGFVCSLIRQPEAWMGADCLGALCNSLGIYFLFRFLIRHPDEVIAHLRLLVWASIIIGIAMSYEWITHKNLFHIFGGVPEFVGERDGRFRCQGPFRHPILAGTFAATLIPLMIGLWLQGGRNRWFSLLGIISASFSTVVAASSGALLTCVAAMMGFGLWLMRERMHLFRRGIVVLIIVLALVMKVPVYYLIAKVSDVLGGTGWHRSYLIDQTIEHFGQWWLFGTSYTANWAPAGEVLVIDPNNMDITNHYIVQGIHGGVLGLGLFIAIIVTSFQVIGRAWRNGEVLFLKPLLLWALGVCLACHCTAFISISYFDQIQIFWLWLLAVFAVILSAAEQEVASDSLVDTVANAVDNGIPASESNNMVLPALSAGSV